MILVSCYLLTKMISKPTYKTLLVGISVAFAVLCFASCKSDREKPILIDGLAGEYSNGRNLVRVSILSSEENRLIISNVEFSSFLDSAIELQITDKVSNDLQIQWIDSQKEEVFFCQSRDSRVGNPYFNSFQGFCWRGKVNIRQNKTYNFC